MFYERLAHGWTSMRCIKKDCIWSLEFIVFFLSFKPLKLCHLCLIRRDWPRVFPLLLCSPDEYERKQEIELHILHAFLLCKQIYQTLFTSFVWVHTVKPKAVLKVFAVAGLNILTSKYGNSTQQIVQYVAYTVGQEKAGLAIGVFSIFI